MNQVQVLMHHADHALLRIGVALARWAGSHRGAIELVSEPGRGSSFRVYLSAAPPDGVDEHAPVAPPDGSSEVC
jgi:hypothetical protein